MSIDYSRIQAKLSAAPKQARAIRKDTAIARTARTNAAELKQAAARTALAESALRADTLQAERFTRLYESFDVIARASSALDQCTIVSCSPSRYCATCRAAHAAIVAFKRQRDAVFQLPLLPADVRPNGRFYATARKLITNNATRITHGDLLLTASGIGDIVQEALFLAYVGARDGDLVSVNSIDTGWVASNGAWTTRVPTIGAMYRATRRAYYRELSFARQTFKTTDSVDRLKESLGDSFQPTAIEPRVDEVLYSFHQRPLRLKLSTEPMVRETSTVNAQAADLYAAYANALVQGDTLEHLSGMVGMTAETMRRKLSTLRIDNGIQYGIARLLPGSTEAPKRAKRATRSVEREGMTTVRGTRASAVVVRRVAPNAPVNRVRTHSAVSLAAYREAVSA